MGNARARVLPPEVIDKAIHWYVRLASGQPDHQQQDAFAQWQRADPDHAEAWRRIEALRGSMTDRLASIPSNVSREVLGSANASPQRRHALKVLLWGGTGLAGSCLLSGPLGLSRQWHIATADLRTQVGEQKRLTLPDGTVLRLNTASAVDVRFDQATRRIILHEGEVDIVTAPDALGRRFVVEMPSATLVPIGTRFGVRLSDGGVLLTVQEGAVDLTRETTSSLRVPAGYQVFFDHQHSGRLTPLDESAVAWTAGLIRANRMTLHDFLAELSRYRRGWIRCEASVAQLRLTALYTLVGADPVNAILDTLPQVLQVSIRRVSPWLILVGPAKH
ncbi:transmembrane sensor [Xanthomonas campestris]|uniref:FecR domain-containing protein n=1 Tax=Xanthomonas TaxID=338 RepID=UPI000CEE4017|nr:MULTISPECIES: FecR domain-containing protein [Xanthomonas]MBB5734888.1 transmembrane sensor [Xanthomonas sp. CFBP 8152]NIJ75606.1 transmembrane sensor [Xanthomonas sp. CFBP 8151]PPT80826.1 hypothetical protein XarbCFBP8152_03055 [Xanthomonas arboricola]